MHDPEHGFETQDRLPEDWELSSGFIIDGRYTIEHKIAQGGAGDVFLAYDARAGTDDRRCALKILRPEHMHDRGLAMRFLREAETTARIASPHVVDIRHVGHVPELYGVPYFAMENLDGMDLLRLSDEEGPLALERVIRIAYQTASALDAAHRAGIIHRDLKPDNLFMSADRYGRDWVKVLDFGVAKVKSPDAVSATKTGDFFGTPMYMSPEQCLGRSHEVGPTADVWAFGLIVFRLLVGDELWMAETIAKLIAEIAYEPIPRPSERGADFLLDVCGSAFDEWFAICCAREPEKRFQSATTAANALALALRTARG